MFDVRAAYMELNGRTFTSQEFREAVLKMRIDHQKEIASEVEVEDLIHFARTRGWLKESSKTTDVRVEIHVLAESKPEPEDSFGVDLDCEHPAPTRTTSFGGGVLQLGLMNGILVKGENGTFVEPNFVSASFRDACELPAMKSSAQFLCRRWISADLIRPHRRIFLSTIDGIALVFNNETNMIKFKPLLKIFAFVLVGIIVGFVGTIFLQPTIESKFHLNRSYNLSSNQGTKLFFRGASISVPSDWSVSLDDGGPVMFNQPSPQESNSKLLYRVQDSTNPGFYLGVNIKRKEECTKKKILSSYSGFAEADLNLKEIRVGTSGVTAFQYEFIDANMWCMQIPGDHYAIQFYGNSYDEKLAPNLVENVLLPQVAEWKLGDK